MFKCLLWTEREIHPIEFAIKDLLIAHSRVKTSCLNVSKNVKQRKYHPRIEQKVQLFTLQSCYLTFTEHNDLIHAVNFNTFG